MTRYADPRRCPDCAGTITAGLPVCPACGLPLAGTLAQRLYQTLLTADGLLAELRASAGAQAATPAGTAPSAVALARAAGVGPAAPPLPAPSPSASSLTGPPFPPSRRDRHRGLGAASVPKILLGLGAGCVLVAALVFLAVTWSALGVGGRTALLVVVTLACAALAWFLARRPLRGGAEALSVLAWGLLTLDLYGARDAGWLGDISDASYLLLLGAALLATGTAAGLAARRAPVGRLTGAELVAGLGTAAVCLGVAGQPVFSVAVGLLLSTLVAGGVVAVAARLELRWTQRTAVVVALASWAGLVGVGLVRITDHPSLTGVWGDLRGWPLLAAATVAAGAAALPGRSHAFRVGAAAVALVTLAVPVAAPALDEGATTLLLTALALLAAGAAGGWFLPPRWRPATVLLELGAGLVVTGFLVAMTATSAAMLVDAAVPTWAAAPTDRFTTPSTAVDLPPGWLLPVVVAALLGTAAVLVGMLGHPAAAPTTTGGAREPAGSSSAPGRTALSPVRSVLIDLRVVTVLLAVATVLALVLHEVPIWTAVLAGAALGLGFVAWWWRGQAPLTLLSGAVLLTGAAALSLAAAELTAAALAAALLAAAAAHLHASHTDTSAVAGAVVMAAAGGSGWTWAYLAGVAPQWGVLTTLVVLAAVTLLVQPLPGRVWACPDSAVARAGIEVGAAVAALPLVSAGVLLAPQPEAETWTAIYLTVAGAAVTALGLLRSDRRRLLPAGALLLLAASWVRLHEIGVGAVEAYTVPAALVLGATGLVQLCRHRDLRTAQALTAALSLGLVPSLLWVLADPTGVRPLLLGLGCFALVVAGARMQWAAPLGWGAAVGAVLVVWLAAPYVGAAVPRWVLIGSAGAVLIALGVTYEQRLQEARRLAGYLHELR